jgi:hypothetical protein
VSNFNTAPMDYIVLMGTQQRRIGHPRRRWMYGHDSHSPQYALLTVALRANGSVENVTAPIYMLTRMICLSPFDVFTLRSDLYLRSTPDSNALHVVL